MAFMQRTLRLAAALAIVGLGACQASGGSFASLGGSPSGVPIAFVSIDGPPAPVRSALTEELVSAAASRQIEIAGAGAPARYQVRGYLSAETSASGETALAYVWDMFDAEKRRAKRLTGTSPVPVSAADPWSGLDQAALARVAAASMDEIAGFLTEAKSEASAGL